MAEHFKDKLREGGDELTRYRTTRDDVGLGGFSQSQRRFECLDARASPQPAHAARADMLEQMNASYSDYVQLAAEVHQRIQAFPATASLPVDVTDKVGLTRRRLFDLGQNLSQAHLDLRKQLLVEAHQMLVRLRLTVLGALALLFLSGVALAVFVYRDMIAPLRCKLVESQAMVERHEKLAVARHAGRRRGARNPQSADRHQGRAVHPAKKIRRPARPNTPTPRWWSGKSCAWSGS